MAKLGGNIGTLNGSVQQLSGLVTTLPAGQNFVKSVALQAGPSNSGTVYVGTATMTATTDAVAFIAAGAGLAYNGGDEGAIDLSGIYLLGTNNDKVYISFL